MLNEYTDISNDLGKKLALMEQLAEIGYWEFDVQKHQFCNMSTSVSIVVTEKMNELATIEHSQVF